MQTATKNHTLESYVDRSNRCLTQLLPATSIPPSKLHRAMHYVVLNGGKRIRPLLVYTVGELLNVQPSLLDGPACAVEFIHAYSLTHDDLPAMDDDDLRRGRPTCHKAFDEATAILVGDALHSLAFQCLTAPTRLSLSDTTRIKMVQTLAQSCGSLGMAGGQSLDLSATGQAINQSAITQIHNMKTGALINACVQLAMLAAEKIAPRTTATLNQLGELLGLAYQIHDDILDIESPTSTLGKQQGADIAQNKCTYPAVVGLRNAKNTLANLQEQIQQLFKILPESKNFSSLIGLVFGRLS